MITYLEAKTLFLKGYSLTRIEREFGFKRKRLSRYLKKDNINIILNNQRFIYNEDYFKSIDSEEKAYWLGFLYADGYVGNPNKGKFIAELCLAEIDKTHVEKFRNTICKEKNISLKKTKLNNKIFKSYRFSVINKVFVEFLIQQGCTPSKSFTISLPSLSKNLTRHFLRGYFDGDGSFHKDKKGKVYLSITSGSISFLNSIQNIFKEEIADYTEVSLRKDKRAIVYTFSKARTTAIKILNYLYKDSNIYLDRKFNKYKIIIDNLPSSSEMN